MAVFIDPRSGERYENVPDEDSERARREFGLVPEAEFSHQKEVEGADRGFLSAAGKGFQRGLGALQDFASSTGIQPPTPGGEAFGPGGGLPAFAPPQAPAPPAAPETFPGGYDEQARLEREGRPFASGLGTGLATAVPAAIAGAAGAALGGPALFGAGVAGVVAEAGVEAVTQEYDDAWFEERPMQVQNVVANTFMFAPLDFAFRGALKGIGSVFSGKPAAKSAIGSRNVVSEAQGAARELVDPVGGGSVGAARAADLEDEFHGAIAQMSDRDAAVLARDADPHFHLIAQDASEAFTRLNNGLSDNVGNKLKYEDFATYAEAFDGPTLERQSKWWTGVSEQADEASRKVNALSEGDATALDFGNLGKKVTQTIDDFNRRISESNDPGQRIVLVDDFKKSLDRLSMSIDASRSVDTITRSELKGLIAPTREGLRKGLENAKLFGGAADLQKALNSPWHGLLEHWSKVQKTLTEETGHVQFDVSGAGRITRESTVDRMLSLIGKDPRSNQEFARHLSGALENIQGLIDARQAHGIARRDGLEEMAGDIRNLMEDWNLAQTVGVAKNRVDALKKDPRKWGTLALNLGERLPMVGQPIQVARTLGNAFADLHIEKGTPLARVWDSAYKRYALNPVFQDPSIIRNYPDWIAESLRTRGGRIPPGGAGGIASGGAPNMPAPGAVANDTARSVAGPAVASAAPAPADALRSFPTNKRVPLTDVRRSLGDMPREQQDELLKQMQRDGELVLYRNDNPRELKPADHESALTVGDSPRHLVYFTPLADAAKRARARAGQSGKVVIGERAPVAKSLSKDEIAAVDSFATDYRAAGMLEQGVPDEQILAQLPEYTSEGLEELRQRMPTLKAAWRKLSVWNPTSDKPLVKGMSLSDDEIQSLVSKGEWSSPNSTYATWDPAVARKFAGRNVSQGKRPVLLVYDGVPTAVPSVGGVKKYDTLSNADKLGEEMIIPRGITFKVELGPVEEGVQTIHLRGPADGEGGYVNFAGDRVGSNFTLGDVAKSPMGVVTGAGAAGLAINAAVQQRAEQPPDSPAHAYRDALREVDQAGTQQVKTLASEVLRRKPPRGKDRDPLTLFAGKGSIQDAVEATRERLDEIASDPATLLQQLGSSAGELGRTHPSVYMAVAQRAAQVAAYLQSVIPQRTVTTLLDPKGAPVSFDRAWDYAARFVGATQPRAALREVARGAAPPEMVESVAQNWPELWDGFRVEMLGQVQRMHAAGRHIPSEKLRRLDRLLGLGGQLDASATLEVAQHMLAAQDAEAQQRQQQGQSGGGQAPAGGSARAALRTPLASINQERASG